MRNPVKIQASDERLLNPQRRKDLSRREFFGVTAGLVATLPGATDELGTLLENFEDHLAPMRGETRPSAPVFRWKRRRATGPPPDGGQLFLTFDDGPLPCTGSILDQLAEKGQKATFFVLGKNLSNPMLRPLAMRALQEGHDLGNHSFNHPDFSRISINRAKQEIISTHSLIQQLVQQVGADPDRQNRFFRFPYGLAGSRTNYLACQDVLAELNYKIAWWDLDTNDWRMELPWFPKRPSSVVACLNRARPGDVVLLHDRVKTSECLSAMLRTLENYKLASLPLSRYELGSAGSADKDTAEKGLHPVESLRKPSVDELAAELSQAFFPQGEPADAFTSAVTLPHSDRSNFW